MNTDFPINENWRPLPCPDYVNYYSVSDHGNVMRVAVGRGAVLGALVKIYVNEKAGGYCYVRLCANGKAKNLVLHRMVALAFLGDRPDGYDIDHIDTNKLNNRADNLEYVTHLENVRRAAANGLNAHGETHGRAKLTSEQVAEIRASYVPYKTTLSDLATKYNMSLTAIRGVVKGLTWHKETTS